MRRIFLAILCLCLLTTAVSAAGSVTSAQSNAILSSDGTCQISMVLQLTVESTETALRFPLPGAARDITLNGDRAKTSRADSLRWVDLSKVVHGPGNYTLTLHYSLPDLVREEEEGLMLSLPMLSGFSYPIDGMEFSITLPGEPTVRPTFTSTYHPESLEDHMEYTIEGNVISGYFLDGLKDYETMSMSLAVTSELFPQNMAKRWSLSYDDLLQYGLLLLAVLYWLIFLRCGLPRRLRRVQAPEGITAGELGCCMGGQGVDFPTTVLSWAEMGYLTIQVDSRHRVLLHKSMDMGNERSEFENRCFRALFGKREKVDAGSEFFARLSRKYSKSIPGAWRYYKKSSGNPLIFRCIAALIGAVAGYSLAAAFVSDTVWQVILAILLVPLGGVLSWLIQEGVRGVHLRHRLELLIGAGSCLLWLLLSSWCGEWAVAFMVIFSQTLAGFAAIHGSRRTEEGLLVRNEIFGLRKYLKAIPAEDLRRILEDNPEYYFSMAPYAIALGVDRSFAHRFGPGKLAACPYLEVPGSQNLSAKQWNDHLRRVIQVMDDRQRKLILQKLFGDQIKWKI